MARACPQCGGGTLETTCVGYLRGRDENKATCHSCGWIGKAWQCESPQVPDYTRMFSNPIPLHTIPLYPKPVAPSCSCCKLGCFLCTARMIVMSVAVDDCGYGFECLPFICEARYQPDRERIPR